MTNFKPTFGHFSLLLFISTFLLTTFFFNFSIRDEQQFSYLARSFLQGKLYFLQQPLSWNDAALYDGQYYWPTGIMPALILVPFVFVFRIFGVLFTQGYLQFFLVLGTFYFVFRITKKLAYTTEDSLLLALAFSFASAFLGLAFVSWSWYFAQVVSTFCLLLALFLWLEKKHWFWIGLMVALAGGARPPVYFATVFFFLQILLSSPPLKTKIRNSIFLMVPIISILLLTAVYNYARFGDPFEYGQKYALLSGVLDVNRNHGVINLIHLPGNLYYTLMSMPEPVFRDATHVLKFPYIQNNQWGMSIFVTSPYLFYLFVLRYKDRLSKILLLTVIAIATPSLIFFSLGFSQFGHRYSLDYFPFLFFLLVRNYKLTHDRLSPSFKCIILFSAIFNYYLFLTN